MTSELFFHPAVGHLGYAGATEPGCETSARGRICRRRALAGVGGAFSRSSDDARWHERSAATRTIQRGQAAGLAVSICFVRLSAVGDRATIGHPWHEPVPAEMVARNNAIEVKVASPLAVGTPR
jgi:hypothetical protein